MFDAYCPHHDGRVLVTSRRIICMEKTSHGSLAPLDEPAVDGSGLRPHGAGLLVRYRCWCGEIAVTRFDRPMTVAS
ncbi:MAG: hypothetical protein SGJ13_13835 [Actinomycetota bacterium]|nr:hypothetical protein [Actinomycetota bacterium]